MARSNKQAASQGDVVPLGGESAQDRPPVERITPGPRVAPPQEPRFGTATPVDPGGAVPRVVRGTERAPDGLTRYRVRCANYGPQPARYILARDRDEAKEHYLSVQRIDALLARLEKSGQKPEPPELVVVALED